MLFKSDTHITLLNALSLVFTSINVEYLHCITAYDTKFWIQQYCILKTAI